MTSGTSAGCNWPGINCWYLLGFFHFSTWTAHHGRRPILHKYLHSLLSILLPPATCIRVFKWIQSWLMLEQVGQSLNSSSRTTSRLTNTAHSLQSNLKPKSLLLWSIESWTLYFCFNLVHSAATNNEDMSLVWPFFKTALLSLHFRESAQFERNVCTFAPNIALHSVSCTQNQKQKNRKHSSRILFDDNFWTQHYWQIFAIDKENSWLQINHCFFLVPVQNLNQDGLIPKCLAAPKEGRCKLIIYGHSPK